ncbi:cyclic nucleotide-binding domain-containing protein [Aestuariicella sp. G3-2]|uniref:cyclic nucleotide-binding domain-containing protein n=1 Tax=Pseudomaricurvus albidus TaxID=2842452 RepID=UPI001C0E478C|nr:cyclic nucleotide-binding domain-containing protein [Aestuariicella albida]MBU3071129.1 cyclic nucleotide-binding domain-containing protein [Aestuariicella albida]
MSNPALIAQLKQFSPFNTLDDQYVQQVADHSKIITEEKGKLLFRRGKKADSRYYLLEGTVDLVGANFATESVVAGDERASQTLTDTSPTQVSAVAKSEVKLLMVEADFLDLALVWSQATPEEEEEANLTAPLAKSDLFSNDDPLSGLNLSKAHVEVEESHGDWMSGLFSSLLFSRVPPAHIRQLFTCFEAIEVKAGQNIVKEGETGDYFYVIDRGQAQVKNVTGQVNVKLETGQYFGEEALVAETPRNATVTMLTDGLLMRLGKEDFTKLLHEPVQKTLSFSEYEQAKDKCVLLDVRMPLEFRFQHMEGSKNIPLSSLRNRFYELDTDTQYAIADNAGRRSQLAAYLLCQAGYDAWILQNSEETYEANSATQQRAG